MSPCVYRGRIAPAESAAFVRLLLALPIVVDRVARRGALEATSVLARRHALSAYDAAYLELGIPLATLDDRLFAAADDESVPRFVSTPG